VVQQGGLSEVSQNGQIHRIGKKKLFHIGHNPDQNTEIQVLFSGQNNVDIRTGMMCSLGPGTVKDGFQNLFMAAKDMPEFFQNGFGDSRVHRFSPGTRLTASRNWARAFWKLPKRCIQRRS